MNTHVISEKSHPFCICDDLVSDVIQFCQFLEKHTPWPGTMNVNEVRCRAGHKYHGGVINKRKDLTRYNTNIL